MEVEFLVLQKKFMSVEIDVKVVNNRITTSGQHIDAISAAMEKVNRGVKHKLYTQNQDLAKKLKAYKEDN